MAFTLTFATLLCLGALAALFGLSAYFSESGHAGSNLVLSGGYDDLLTYSLTGFFIAVIYGATPLPSLFAGRNRPTASDEAETHRPDTESNYSSEPPTLKPATETDKGST